MCNISIGKYVHANLTVNPVYAQYKKAENQFCNTAIHTECDRNESEDHLNQLSALQHNHGIEVRLKGASV